MSIESIVTGVMLTAGAAAAATGGVTAGEGQVVVTGDSSASVQVTNVINAGSEGGTSHTEVTKTVDGKATTEVVDKTYEPGEPVVTKTVVTATSGGATTTEEGDTTASGEIIEVAGTSSEATTSPQVSVFAEAAGGVLGFISQLFHSVLGIFK